jgi:hypothetical protein
MTSFRKISDALRRWLIGAIKEAVAPVERKKPLPGHVALMRLQAARSLLADGLAIEQAAAAVGVEPADLRHFLRVRAPRRP